MSDGNTMMTTLPKLRRLFRHLFGLFGRPVGGARRFLRRHRRGTIRTGAVAAVLVAAVLVMSLVSVPYYALHPGDVYSATGAVSSETDTTYEPMSLIGFVTVSSRRTDTLWEWMRAQFDSSVTLQHEDVFNRGMHPDERRSLDTRLMTLSQAVSVLVALRELGHDLPDTEVTVAGLVRCMPAEQHLAIADVILEVGGRPVPTAAEAAATIRERSPAEVVQFGIRRQGESTISTVDIRLGSSADACLPPATRTSAAEERPLLGVTLVDRVPRLDVEIDFATGGIAGPSAGLAFALSVLDLLSPGELTEGRPVAVTGTISPDGSVGAVGGLRQKVRAAERRKFDLMLVPEGQYEEARDAAGDGLEIVEVATWDEALATVAPNWSPPEI